MIFQMMFLMIKMSESTLELLKNNKCYCLRRTKVIDLVDCEINTCHREKGCRKATNRKVDKEMENGRNKNHI